MVGSGRQTSFGVKGTRQGKVTVWRGVPYAAAPTGEARFQPPRPSPPWDGPRNAADFGPSSVSTEVPGLVLPSGSGVQPESEDCLYLNVWSPRARGKPRPVLVWIHGGAFVFGSGSNFDGAWLATRGDAVIVTLNYRLGPWGFLDLATVGGAGFERAVNVGLLDQVAALTWIRDNIEAFGGDPERVTVIGQASGANCVGALLAMPAAAGLFHRAVMQSGGADRVQSRWRSRAAVVRMLNGLGLDYREADRLTDLSVDAIRTAAGVLLRDADDAELEGEPFVPSVDGTVLPGHPLAGLVAGASSEVPLLISTCREEANLYLAISPEGFIKAKELRARAWFGDVAWDHLSAIYQRGAMTPERGRADLLTDLLFGMPAVRTAEAHGRGGGRTWLLRFDHTPGQVPFDQLGPCHGSDLPFTWLDYTGPAEAAFPGLSTTADRTVAETLQDLIVTFARTGDPGTAMLPAWPSYQPGRRAVMSLSARSSLDLDPSADRRRAWDGLPLPQTLNVRRSSRSSPRRVERDAAALADRANVSRPVRAPLVAGQPVGAEPVAGQPVAGQPIAEQPVTAAPVVEQPVVEQPVAAGPVGGEHFAGEHFTGDPVAGEHFAPEAGLAAPVIDSPTILAPAADTDTPAAAPTGTTTGTHAETQAASHSDSPPTMFSSLEELEAAWEPPTQREWEPPAEAVPAAEDGQREWEPPTEAAPAAAEDGPRDQPEYDGRPDDGWEQPAESPRKGRRFRPRRGSGRSPNG